MAQATQDKEDIHPPPLKGYGGQAENAENFATKKHKRFATKAQRHKF